MAAHTALEDSVITNEIKKNIYSDNSFKGFDVNVETKRGIVLLSGELGTYDLIACAYKIASTTSGVKAVYNGLVCKLH